MAYREKNLELTIADLLMGQGFIPTLGITISRHDDSDILIEEDLYEYLNRHYLADNITENEISTIILQLKNLSSGALYDSNRRFCTWLADGFIIKRENHKLKDIMINLLDYRPLDGGADDNIYRFVTQLEIQGDEKRIPDAILYINGLPLVVFEFKSAIRENATIYHSINC